MEQLPDTEKVKNYEASKPRKKWDMDDKDLAMIVIGALVLTGTVIMGILMLVTKTDGFSALAAMVSTGITALAALATGRKQGKGP